LTTPNVGEAGILGHCQIEASNTEDVLAAAKRLVGLGVGVAIITRGERGLCYATSDTSGQIPAIRTRVVGPTGVGDAMTAAVVFALLNEIPIDEALQLGVAAASLTLGQLGAVVQDLTLQRLYDEL
jgi:pseudouridine kinase